MKTLLKKAFAAPLRYAARQILQRPWLKARIRDLVTRMPAVYSFALRVMFEAPAMGKSTISGDQKNLSPDALRVHRALKQAMRTHQK